MPGIGMVRSPLARRLVGLAALAAVYLVAAKLGLRVAFVNPSATAVWAPTGIALAAFLVSGDRVWPAIFVGAFLANVTTAGTVLTSLGVAAGNTLEGLAGAWLLRRYAGGSNALQQPRGVFIFALLAAGVSTTVSATIGVASLALGGFVPVAEIGKVWLTWWLGDASGDLIVAPVLLLWIARHDLHGTWTEGLEAAGMFATLALAAGISFGGLLAPVAHRPLSFLCLPPLVWAAYRFGRRGAATAVLVVAGASIWGTLRGLGTFAVSPPNEALMLLQSYLGVASVTTLALAAVVGERRNVEAQLRHLAVSDPLTGLANYRRLLSVMEAELQRSDRTLRPFAVLFFDLDGLKLLNDRHGHLVGSRALWRVAEALRACCRSIDTAARYGGDEFALVLPESDEAAAREVGRRVTAFLTADGEEPPVSVSTGIAESPRDGTTVGELLAKADREQYAVKARVPGHARRRSGGGPATVSSGS